MSVQSRTENRRELEFGEQKIVERIMDILI